MRKDITEVIDDIKYHSDSLTDLDRLPVIQLKVILAKINKLTEKTTILLHYIEKKSQDPKPTPQEELKPAPPVQAAPVIDVIEEVEDSTTKDTVQEVEEKSFDEETLTDLMSAIGINEKYLFASTLFNGNMEAFKSNIAAINDLISLEDANTYLEVLKQKYNWEDENKVVKEFYQLIQRRYESF